MHKPLIQETIVTCIFILILILLLNPFHFWMPEKLVYIMLGGTLVLFGVYVSFVVQEKPQDERESLHRFIANRSAYLLGSAILVIAIVYQGFAAAAIDPWLLIVLGVMVITKMISLIRSERKR